MTRCPTCAARLAQARSLAHEHSRVAYAIGSESIAVHRIVSALDALAALASLSPDAHRLGAVESDGDLRTLLANVASAGAMACWGSRFAPVLMRGADPASAAVAPWGHLTDENAGLLRDAAARLLRAQVEARTAPRAYAPPLLADDDETPTPRGCLLCGVGSVLSHRPDVWAVAAPPPSSIGGRGPERVRGYLCPPCADAVAEEGAIGPTAMERALLAHLGVPSGRLSAYDLVGLEGWAARPRSVNEKPWAHLAGLDALRDELHAMA
jgi:hypothetical protein